MKQESWEQARQEMCIRDRLYPSHYRVDSGLAPVSNVRRQAHQK